MGFAHPHTALAFHAPPAFHVQSKRYHPLNRPLRHTCSFQRRGSAIDTISYALRKKPIVTAITRDADLTDALSSSANVAFLLGADILTLAGTVERLHAAGKLSFVHLDLMTGIARDTSGIRYLAETIGVDGVVTTRTSLIAAAKQHGLIAVQRTFILDSVSIDQTLKMLQDSRPDAIEVLPGLVIPHVMHLLKPSRHTPIIAGGLLSTPEHVRSVLTAGCIGASTSSRILWRWQDAGFPDGPEASWT
ncbi:glycerol-3-phosphate responsive antiterminator [Alicyclobacillus macrosporangiidus]|uniref:glycerol-3-phosphate responsive antiterminator n=1 Tax=Alicyclobacillus macrosporangiidus TaxID=392015 RepID=UPI0009DD65CD|nr:glycerol-3-phosphate responsive antiterminator [Alicyclobacillus macrosporangiidus]